MNAIRQTLLTLSVISVLIGGLGIYGFIPFPASITNSTSIQNVAVVCPQNVCTTTFSFNNVNQTMTMQLWFIVKNPSGQTVANVVQSNLNVAPGQSATLSQQLGNFVSGSYSLNIFALSNSGVAISQSVFTNFNTGTVTLQIDPPGNGISITANPPASGGIYQSGSQVALTANVPSTLGVFQCWYALPIGQSVGGCGVGTATPTANPLTLTLTQNYEVGIFVSPPASQFYVTVQPFGSPFGTISPSSAQNVYQTSAGGPTTVTFTETPNSCQVFNQWTIQNNNAGTNPSISITYPQVNAYGNTVGLQAVYTHQPTLTIVDSSVWPGRVSVSPTFGVTCITQGQQVTVTASNIAAGYTWGGWILDAITQSSLSLSITVTMDQLHILMPNILKNSANQCTIPAGQSTCTSSATGVGTSCTITAGTSSCSYSTSTGQSSSTSQQSCTYTYTTTTNLLITTITNTVTATASAGSSQCNSKGGTVSMIAVGFLIGGVVLGAIAIGLPERKRN